MRKVQSTLSVLALACLQTAHSVEINFSGLTVDQQLVGQDGWVSIYEGAGGKIKAIETIPSYGDAQKSVATNGSTDPASGQFAKADVASGLSSNGIIRMDVLVQYQNGSPIRFAPAGDGVTTAGESASSYFAPYLQVGFDSVANQARLVAGASSSVGSVRVDLPPSIGWLEWVWFRLELDCTDTASTGNVVATASYRNLSDGENEFSVIPDLVDIPLSISGMADVVEDPATWTSVWVRHENVFSAPGALAAIRLEPVETAPLARDVWSVLSSPLPNLSITSTAITADIDRFYAVVVKPDQSAHVYAIDDQGSVLSTSQILGPAIEGVDGSGVRADDHNGFSIGIDALGYLHVTGNHHNSAWNYWVSDTPRSAASFTDHSTPHDVMVSGTSIFDTNRGEIWKNSIIGGWFTTYTKFARDNFGRLWLTARIKARDDDAEVVEDSLAGLRGGLLARYDVHGKGLWEPFGARAPAPGNTYRLPVITWDETGRDSNGDEWYQGYRFSLDFDSRNDMHLCWVAYGSVAEGAPAGSVRTDGASHFNYMRRRDHDGVFLEPKGAVATIPATRWESNLIYNNPGNLDFGTYVTTGEEDEPFLIYIEEREQFLSRKTADGSWERISLPMSKVDSGWQVLYHEDTGLIVTDLNQIHRSVDRGDSWETISADSFKQLDKAYFRRTGNLIGARIDAEGDLRIHELRLNRSSIPTPADDHDFETDSGQLLNVIAPGVMGNDLHPQRLSSAVSVVTGTSHGALSLAPDGGFSYTPDNGFSGQDSFVYEIEDSSGNKAQATAYISVHEELSGLLAYEPFDLVAGTLENGSGVSSYGFDGPWQQNYLDPSASPLTVGAGSLGFDNNARGNRLSQDGDGTLETAYRKFDEHLHFSTAEEHTRYLSFVATVENAPTGTEQHFVSFVDQWGDRVAGFRRYDNNRVLCFIQGDAQQSTNSGQSGQHFDPWSGDWLIVLKLETHPTNPDTVYVKRYQVGDDLVEPTATGTGSDTWSVFASNDTDMTVEGILIGIVDSVLAFDEIRYGSTFESVTSDVASSGVDVVSAESSVREEDGNSLSFQFSRADSVGALSVFYSVGGSALSGTDYDSPSGVVDFMDGESVVEVSFNIFDDTIPEDSESVEVSLIPDAAYQIANGGSATAEILYSDLVDLRGAQFNQEEQTGQTATVTLHNPTAEAIDFNIDTEISQILEYDNKTSDDVGGPVYDWIEISDTGTRLNDLDNDVSETEPNNFRLSLGDFTFPYYGEIVEELIITPHGMINAGDGDLDRSYSGNQNISQDIVSLTYSVIAPMWTRMIVGDDSGVYYEFIDENYLVIQYENVQLYRSPSHRATFQIVINRGGTIQFNYKTDNIPNSQHKFTVGIREKEPNSNADEYGDNVLNYHAFTTIPSPVFVEPGKSVIYRVPQVWVSPNRSLINVPSGESKTIDLSFYTYAFTDGHSESGDVLFNIPDLTHDESFEFQLSVGEMSEVESWRKLHFGHVLNQADAADSADPDGDGLLNLVEYGFGTMPTSDGDRTHEWLVDPQDSDRSLLRFTRNAADVDYIIESVSSLGSGAWAEVMRNPGNVGENIEIEVDMNEHSEFFRIRLENE